MEAHFLAQEEVLVVYREAGGVGHTVSVLTPKYSLQAFISQYVLLLISRD